jgi:hypothetical protein
VNGSTIATDSESQGRGQRYTGGLLPLTLFACLVLAHDAEAQATSPEDLARLVNHAYVIDHGFGAYSVANQRATLLQIPVSISLRSIEKYPWGLRLRLTGVFGIHNFTTIEDLELGQIRSVTVIPGLELLLPLGRASMARPYVDVGIARVLTADRDVLISSTGVRFEFVFLWKRFEIGVEPRLQFNLAKESKRNDDDFGTLALKVDARHPLWFKMGAHQPEMGVYVESGYLFDDLSFTKVEGGTLDINEQYEVGVSFGFQDRPKVLFLTVPRIGVGYRFGDGLKGFRIRIGGDRITRLPR